MDEDELAGVGLVLEAPQGHGHMAPCLVKGLVEGSASHACGGISPGDLLTYVDGVPVQGLSIDEIASMIIGDVGSKVLLSFESTEREQKGKSRKFSRRLTRGRSTGTYSAASSQMGSPVISSSTASYKIPDIDRDPLGNAGDPEYRASTGSFKALSSFLPDIPRLSLKNLRSPAPAMNSAREQRDTRPSWLRDSWTTESTHPQTDRAAYDHPPGSPGASSTRSWSSTFSPSSTDIAARESALARAIEFAKMTKDELNRDLLVAHESVTKAPIGMNRTTVGISYEEKNSVITAVLVGGPAFISRKVHKGDTIVAIDGHAIEGSRADIQDLLKGIDQPGSVVVLFLKRHSGVVEQVRLQRMMSSLIADKRKLFDFFVKANDRAKNTNKDETMMKYLDDSLELWTQMMIEEAEQYSKCEDNVARMQSTCTKWLEQLIVILGKGNLDLSGLCQIRYAALELECCTAKDDLRAASNKTMSLLRDVEILEAEIGGNKRWAKSQIINAKLEAEVSRRELVDKSRNMRDRDDQLREALKDAHRFQSEAEELRRQLMSEKNSMRTVERNYAKTEAENVELREQLQKSKDMLKKANDWNEQNDRADSAQVLCLKKIVKDNESEILSLNKQIHELKLAKQKAVDEEATCRKDMSAMQHVKFELEKEVRRHVAITEEQKKSLSCLEEEVRILTGQLREAKHQFEIERTTLLQTAKKEREEAVNTLRAQMAVQWEKEREQLRVAKQTIVTLASEIDQLKNRLGAVEREWQAKFTEEHRECISLENELQNTRTALANLRSSHEHDLLKVRQELDAAHKELHYKEKELGSLQAEVVKLTQINTQLEQNVRALQLEFERLRNEFVAKERLLSEVQAELARVTRLLRESKLQTEKEHTGWIGTEEEAKSLREIVENITDELTRAHMELVQKQAMEAEEHKRADEMKYQLQLLNQELERTKRDMALKLTATVADLQRRLKDECSKSVLYDRRVRLALENLRKLHLEGKQTLTDQLDRVSSLAASLSEEVIQVRSHDQEYESVIRALRHELLEVRETTSKSIATLQTVNRDLHVVQDAANRRFKEYEQETYELRAELTTFKREVEAYHAERSKWEIEMRQLRDELAQTKRNVEKIARPLESDILALNKQLHEVKIALEKMTQKYHALIEHLKMEQDKTRLLEIEIVELKRRLAQLPEYEREMQTELERERAVRLQLERDLKAKDIELERLRVQITNWQRDLKQQNEEIVRVTNELTLRNQEIIDLKRKVMDTERIAAADTKKYQGIIVAKDEEIERLKRQLKEAKSQTIELNNEIVILRNNQADKELLERYRMQLQEAWAATRALEQQINNLEREASERKQWVVSKSQRIIFRVEEAWRNRLRAEMKLKNDALRERDQLTAQLKLLGDKDALIRQLRADSDSHRARADRNKAELDAQKTQADRYRAELEALRKQMHQTTVSLSDSEVECDRLREELARQAKTLKAEVKALRSAPAPPPPPMRDSAHLIRCRELLRLLHSKTHKLSLSDVRVVTRTSSDGCTLGFSYVETSSKPTIVSHVLTGGPAFKSKCVHKGDIILLVDGAEVSGEALTDSLKGNNRPGSKVRITFRKATTGKIEVVELTRTLTATIADKRRLFDLFCEIENSITKNLEQSQTIAFVNTAMDLWGKMELEQVGQDERSSNSINDMQTSCGTWLDEVYMLLGHDLDSMKFDVSLDADLRTAAHDRVSFQTQLRTDFASAINGDVAKVHVVALNTGTNTATIQLQTGVCGGMLTPFEAARVLTEQVSNATSKLRKGNYSKLATSINNIVAVEDDIAATNSPKPGFSLFSTSHMTPPRMSPVAHETLFSSRSGSTPKGTEFLKRSSRQELQHSDDSEDNSEDDDDSSRDPQNDPRVKAMMADLNLRIQKLQSELARKDRELGTLNELSRKLSEASVDAKRSASDNYKLQSEVDRLQREITSLRLSPSMAASDSNIEAGFLRKDLEAVTRELAVVEQENTVLSSSMRGQLAAYAELKEMKTKLETQVMDLEREKLQLKRELDSKLQLQSYQATSITARNSRISQNGSPRISGRPISPAASSNFNRFAAENAKESYGAEAGSSKWDDNFFTNIFGTSAEGGSEKETDKNWDDSYLIDLLGDDFAASRMSSTGRVSPQAGGLSPQAEAAAAASPRAAALSPRAHGGAGASPRQEVAMQSGHV